MSWSPTRAWFISIRDRRPSTCGRSTADLERAIAELQASVVEADKDRTTDLRRNWTRHERPSRLTRASLEPARTACRVAEEQLRAGVRAADAAAREAAWTSSQVERLGREAEAAVADLRSREAEAAVVAGDP